MVKILMPVFVVCAVMISPGIMLGELDIKVTPVKEYAPPLNHPLKVYMDRNRNIFWPMDKPVWVCLATSPEDNAPGFPMVNFYAKTETDLKKIKNKGITLDMPGDQYLRWENHLTGEELLLKFHADGAPPKSRINLTGAPEVNAGHTMVYGKNLQCSFSARDDLSGVENIYVSVNGDAFTICKGHIRFDTDMACHIRYYAVDHVGYAEKPIHKNFFVDLTPPEIFETYSNAPEKIVNGRNGESDAVYPMNTMMFIRAVDQPAGLEAIFYSLDNSAFTAYHDALIFKNPGAHTVTVRAEDRVKNRSFKTISFIIK